ncbi:MAG: arginase family protein [Alphaproteobacteria bacterium]
MGEVPVSWRGLLAGTPTPLLADGVPSFLGVPVARERGELEGADVAILGIPVGAQASPGRPPDEWAEYGRAPADARRFSMAYGGYLPELDLDVFEHLRMVDYGDAEIDPRDPERSLANVERKVRDVLDSGCRLITLGGCVPYASYGIAAAMARRQTGKLGVVSLDAHGDCLDSLHGARGNKELGPGTWQARMWEDCPNIDPACHVELGMRGPRNMRQMVERYRAKGAHWVPAAEIRGRGMAAVLGEALPHAFAGTESTWLSLDMDVLDIGVLPGWGDEPIGLSAWDVVDTVFQSGKRGLTSLSFQFIAPNSRPAAALTCYIVVYLMAGWIEGAVGKAR